MPIMTRKRILTNSQFNELSSYLEKQPCCQHEHTFRLTVGWLRVHNMDVQANLEKFMDLQTMCDCDVLEYLTDEAFEAKRNEPIKGSEIHGVAKWQAAIMGLLLEAG